MDTSGMLSQEEIDALLKGGSSDAEPEGENNVEVESNTLDEAASDDLDPMQMDAVGEIGNISMGSAATALSLLLNQKVQITTPKVTITSINDLRSEYPVPCVIIDVRYTQGLRGSNLLMIRSRDAAVIADLMMGGNGENPSEELNELHLSAVSEAMNQMMGSTATSLSSMFSKKIDISPPQAKLMNLGDKEEVFGSIQEHEPVAKVSFDMQIGNLVDSKIMQLIPLEFAQEMAGNLFGNFGSDEPVASEVAAPPPQTTSPPVTQPISQQPVNQPVTSQQPMDEVPVNTQYYSQPQQIIQNTSPVSVQPVQFAPLATAQPMEIPSNIGLLMDVPLQVTVELGRTKMVIKDILELGTGSIVELDKLAGEPVDLLVNGKLVAKGEVVVIDENFGLRITDIVSPAERVSKI